jgi:cytochrome c2
LEESLRRFLPTLLLLIVLLVIGGLAVANVLGEPSTTRGPYVPTLSDDPQTAQLQALVFAGLLFLIISGTIGTGVIFAVVAVRFTRLLAANAGAAPRVERSAGSKPAASGQGLDIPFSSNRSVAILLIVVVLITVVFQSIKVFSNPLSMSPLGYVPGLGELASMPVFRLPGTHIEGLPSFIAGPGDDVTALHLMLAVLGMAIVGTAVTGFILARGAAFLGHSVQNADKIPPTLPDRLIPEIEGRIAALRQPRARRLPGNPVDAFLIGVNVLLLVVILGIVAFYVVPSYSGVAAVDQAVEATRLAALATQAPPPDHTGGPPPSPAEAMQAAFDALPPGDAAAGQLVFQGAGGCTACHSLEAGVSGVGPSQDGIAQRAGSTRPGYSAEAYLYESITNPNAYVVQGFQSGVMPQIFSQTLTPQQIADVIAFLKQQ